MEFSGTQIETTLQNVKKLLFLRLYLTSRDVTFRNGDRKIM